jgi:hypothetical protein
MDYYILPSGRVAKFKLWDSRGNKLAQAKGQQKGLEPLISKNQKTGFPAGYPSYEIVTVDNITEIIEHRYRNNIFYITDDPAIWKELGVKQRQQRENNAKQLTTRSRRTRLCRAAYLER